MDKHYNYQEIVDYLAVQYLRGLESELLEGAKKWNKLVRKPKELAFYKCEGQPRQVSSQHILNRLNKNHKMAHKYIECAKCVSRLQDKVLDGFKSKAEFKTLKRLQKDTQIFGAQYDATVLHVATTKFKRNAPQRPPRANVPSSFNGLNIKEDNWQLNKISRC